MYILSTIILPLLIQSRKLTGQFDIKTAIIYKMH